MARVALVTGGMGGLGEAVCIKLAALGFRVVTTHSPGNTKAAEWLQAMNNMGYGFKAYACDVSDFDSCKACVDTVTREVGPVDVLVNNVGQRRRQALDDLPAAALRELLETNLVGAWSLCREAAVIMRRQGSGRIINITSVVGETGNPGQANYAAAKAAIGANYCSGQVCISTQRIYIEAAGYDAFKKYFLEEVAKLNRLGARTALFRAEPEST